MRSSSCTIHFDWSLPPDANIRTRSTPATAFFERITPMRWKGNARGDYDYPVRALLDSGTSFLAIPSLEYPAVVANVTGGVGKHSPRGCISKPGRPDHVECRVCNNFPSISFVFANINTSSWTWIEETSFVLSGADYTSSAEGCVVCLIARQCNMRRRCL